MNWAFKNWLLQLRSEKSLRNKVPHTGALSLQITTTPKIGYTYLHTKALHVSGPLSELVFLLGVIATTLATMAPLEISLAHGNTHNDLLSPGEMTIPQQRQGTPRKISKIRQACREKLS